MGDIKPDWLTQLAPAHAPPPASWCPLAPGWWVLLALTVIIIGAVIYWQLHPTVRLRRIALRQLKNLETTISDNVILARELELLLRRFAVARFGRDRVAKLSGDRWIDFIVTHGGAAWADDIGRDLLRAAYGGSIINPNRAKWMTGARTFIKGRA